MKKIWGLISLSLLISMRAQSAGECTNGFVFIDPTSANAGSGSEQAPYKVWPSVLAPGKCYLQKNGSTLTGNITITSAPGTEALPIIIGGYGSEAGGSPILKGTIDVQSSAYLRIIGFRISDSLYPGIVIRRGSKNITVLNNSISNCTMGINLTDGAAGGHLIANNLIFNNTRGTPDFPPFGIGVYKIGNTAAAPTVIYGNTIFGNGSSGIELFASYNYVQDNIVYDNGVNTPGSSGIHVYAGNLSDPAPQFGHNNLIMQNVSIANKEITFQDGNGIQLDQYASRNTVYQNFCLNNDGPGISMYDSNSNYVASNHLLNNAVDTSNSHLFKAELFLGNSDADKIYLSKDNYFSGNQMLALRSSNLAVYVDNAAAAATAKNNFSGNYLYNLSGGDIYYWAGNRGKSASVWNTYIATAGGGGDRFSGLPITSSASAPSPLEFTFPGTGTALSIDGKSIILKGWHPSAGFIAK